MLVFGFKANESVQPPIKNLPHPTFYKLFYLGWMSMSDSSTLTLMLTLPLFSVRFTFIL